MVCSTLKIGETVAIVCGPRARRKRCACGETGRFLCDWKIGKGRTCDKPLCKEHAKQVGEDKHICPKHAADYATWLEGRAAGAPQHQAQT